MAIVGVPACNKEPDPLVAVQYKTVGVKKTNEEAQTSAKDVAVRYFYLINNGCFEEANKLIDRTDLSICTPEILETLYSNVLNYRLGDYNRVVGVDEDGTTVTLTFVNTTDTDKSFDESYDEENTPAWLGMTTPYIPDIEYATTYEIEDVNEDGVIDETDMMWEDNPELNPDYEPEVVDDTELESTATGARSYSGTLTGTVVPLAMDITDIEKQGSKEEESKEQKESKDVVSDVSKDTEGISDDQTNEPALPKDVYKSEAIDGYKTYTMDITVNKVDGVFKIQLPESMTTDTRLMIKVPEDMYIKVGDLELDKSMMNLDDFYVINKLPKVEEFDITLENLILGASEKTINLTERVYYIYSNLVPTRQMKDEVLAYCKPAMQELYTDMWSGVDFATSKFYLDYVAKNGSVQNINAYYDKFINESLSDDSVTEYEVMDVSFPVVEMV